MRVLSLVTQERHFIDEFNAMLDVRLQEEAAKQKVCQISANYFSYMIKSHYFVCCVFCNQMIDDEEHRVFLLEQKEKLEQHHRVALDKIAKGVLVRYKDRSTKVYKEDKLILDNNMRSLRFGDRKKVCISRQRCRCVPSRSISKC